MKETIFGLVLKCRYNVKDRKGKGYFRHPDISGAERIEYWRIRLKRKEAPNVRLCLQAVVVIFGSSLGCGTFLNFDRESIEQPSINILSFAYITRSLRRC